MSNYFITGATGAVGSALCRTLLADSDVQLRLLIRGKDDADVAARLRSLLGFIGKGESSVGNRVSALRGDAAEPRFGLTSESYAALVSDTTNIVHSAGAVRMNLSIEAARHSAIDSAHAIIELARNCDAQGRETKTEFLSTVGVGGRLPGPLPERWIDAHRSYHNTYEQAKAEAEVIAKAAIRDGLKMTIHRPSMVVGDSKSGEVIHFQVFYHLAEFLSGMRTFGFLPDMTGATLDLIPSDYVANAIAWASKSSATAGQILHLCSGPEGAVTLAELRRHVWEEFESFGLRLPASKTVSANMFRTMTKALMLVSSDRNKRALATLPVFLDYLADSQSFGNEMSAKVLNDAGISLPNAHQFIPTILRRYLSQRKPRR